MVSLSNHEVGNTDTPTTSSFDKLRMRPTGVDEFYWRFNADPRP